MHIKNSKMSGCCACLQDICQGLAQSWSSEVSWTQRIEFSECVRQEVIALGSQVE